MDNNTNLHKNQLIDTSAQKRQCKMCHESFNSSSFARHTKTCPFSAFKLSKNQLLDLERGFVTPQPTTDNKTSIKDEQFARLTEQLEEFKKELVALKEAKATVTPHPVVKLNLTDYDKRFEVFCSRLRNDEQAT